MAVSRFRLRQNLETAPFPGAAPNSNTEAPKRGCSNLVSVFAKSRLWSATIGEFQPRRSSRHGGANDGRLIINTRVLRTRLAGAGAVWTAAVLIPLFLVAPAIWNRYPLLQWDTGGYLARWYEGYLVPSRSTVFGLYLHLGEGSDFWLNLGAQALAALWILQMTLRVLNLAQAFRLLAISLLRS